MVHLLPLWINKKAAAKSCQIRNGAMLLEELIAYANGRCYPIRSFSIDELDAVTNNYDPFHLLLYGQWDTLRGRLRGSGIYVKNFRSKEEAIQEIVVSSLMSVHNNALKLLGCCLETEIPTAVFELAENGTLAEHLYHYNRRGMRPLPWKCRLRIAADVANAVVYLHTAFSRPIVDRDIRPHNILLNQDNIAKFSGFSFSLSIPDGESYVVSYTPIGRRGYVAPECFPYGHRLNEKADVYAFGMCMLALLTAQQVHRWPYYRLGTLSDDEKVCFLPDLVMVYLENNRLNEIVDPPILDEPCWPGKMQQLQDFARLALSCVAETAVERPEMIHVARWLRLFEQSAPT